MVCGNISIPFPRKVMCARAVSGLSNLSKCDSAVGTIDGCGLLLGTGVKIRGDSASLMSEFKIH